MSARQPFVPHRPSRSKVTPAQADSSTDENDTFQPNGLLDSSSKPPTEDQAKNIKSSMTLEGGINKPLNIANLSKRKSEANATHPNGKARKTSGDANASAAAHGHPLGLNASHNAHLAAFRPRTSSPFGLANITPGFVPTGRNPRSSGSTKTHISASGNESDLNQAHIPTSHAELADPMSQSSQASPSNPASITSGLRRVSSRPSGETVNETAEGYIRPRGNEPDTAPLSDGFDGPPSDCPQDALAHYDGPKSSQHLVNMGDQLDYGSTATQYRAVVPLDARQLEYASQYSRQPTPLPLNQAEHVPGITQETYQQKYAQVSPHAALHEGHALRRLLGQDLDEYVDKHYETYMEAKKKWAECDLDEWKAGADELTNKFTKMIDFVKEHMTYSHITAFYPETEGLIITSSTKLSLYASLHSSISEHRLVLSEREAGLKEVRESLVRDGANVVGGLGISEKARD